MIQQQLTELEQCLKEAHNPVLSYLGSGTPFNQAHFEQMLELFNLTPNKEIIELYQWKPGLKKEYIYSPDFQYVTFYFGSHIDYAEALEVYQQLMLREKEIYENRFFPIMLMPGLSYESPVLIDLAEKSKTYGQIFYDSPSTGTVEPTSIYDSIHTMLETIITCYRRGIYAITEEGLLDSDDDKGIKVTRKLNKNSDYWNEEDW